MGISENAAKRALYHTGNLSSELAAAWVFENVENPELHHPFSPPTHSQVKTPDYTGMKAAMDASRQFKMVFVVNGSLKMGVGKTAAQVGHATLALYKTLLVAHSEQLNVREWEEKAATKIVTKGENAEHLFALKQAADSHGIRNYLVADAGKYLVFRCYCNFWLELLGSASHSEIQSEGFPL